MEQEHSTEVEPAKIHWTPAVWLATGLGLGMSPIMPGTVGAVWGIPLALALSPLPLWSQAALVTLLVVVGIPLCTKAADDMGGRKDPGAIVWDEIVSLPITFFMAPMSGVWVIVAGFVLHRLFDITKPPPARWLELLPRGKGIMADDIAAGVYSCIALHLLLYFEIVS